MPRDLLALRDAGSRLRNRRDNGPHTDGDRRWTRRSARHALRLLRWLLILWIALHVLVLAALPAAAVGIQAPRRPAAVTQTQPPGNPPAPPKPSSTDASAGSSFGLVPDGDYGTYPASHYEVTFKHGHSWDISRNLLGGLIVLTWTIDKMLVEAGLWVIGFAFHNGVTNSLRGPFLQVGQALRANIVGPLRLSSLVWFVLMVVCAWHALRGRLTRSLGELAISVLAAGLFGIIAANPAGYLQGALDTAGGISGAVLSTAAGNPSAPTSTGDTQAATTAVVPAQKALFNAFIAEPYEVIQWGHILTDPACVDVNKKALAQVTYDDPRFAPFGVDMEANADNARSAMARAGCKDEANWANDPSGERLGSAVLAMFASAAVMVLLGLVGFTVITATIVLAALFAAAGLVAPFAVLPGAGRAVLWKWCAAVVRAALAVIGMAFLLVVLASAVTGFLSSTGGQPPVVRFLLIGAAVAFMFVLRKRIVHAAANVAQQLGDHLTAQRLGTGARSAGRWVAPAAAGSITGMALATEVARTHKKGRQLAQQHRARVATRVEAAGRRRAIRLAGGGSAVPGVRPASTVRGRQATSTLEKAAVRVEATPAGRVVMGAGRGARKAASVAAKSTIGLPVYGPRVVRAARAHHSARYVEMRQNLRSYRAEYGQNLSKLGGNLFRITPSKSGKPPAAGKAKSGGKPAAK